MSVTLTNQSKRMQVFLLLHDEYCAPAGACTCVLRHDGVRLPGSLTIPVGAAMSDLPDAILAVPSVARAMGEATVKAERFTSSRKAKEGADKP